MSPRKAGLTVNSFLAFQSFKLRAWSSLCKEFEGLGLITLKDMTMRGSNTQQPLFNGIWTGWHEMGSSSLYETLQRLTTWRPPARKGGG